MNEIGGDAEFLTPLRIKFVTLVNRKNRAAPGICCAVTEVCERFRTNFLLGLSSIWVPSHFSLNAGLLQLLCERLILVKSPRRFCGSRSLFLCRFRSPADTYCRCSGNKCIWISARKSKALPEAPKSHLCAAERAEQSNWYRAAPSAVLNLKQLAINIYSCEMSNLESWCVFISTALSFVPASSSGLFQTWLKIRILIFATRSYMCEEQSVKCISFVYKIN